MIKILIRENYLSKIRGFYDSDLIKILVGIIEYRVSLESNNRWIKRKILR